MSYTFINLAIDIIKNENRPMSINEIWNKAVEKGLENRLSSFGKTPEKTLAAQIYVSIKQNKENSPFIQISKRPALFYLKELDNDKSIPKNNSSINIVKNTFKERDLHKLV